MTGLGSGGWVRLPCGDVAGRGRGAGGSEQVVQERGGPTPSMLKQRIQDSQRDVMEEEREEPGRLLKS